MAAARIGCSRPHAAGAFAGRSYSSKRLTLLRPPQASHSERAGDVPRPLFQLSGSNAPELTMDDVRCVTGAI